MLSERQRRVCPACGKNMGANHDQYTRCPSFRSPFDRTSSPAVTTETQLRDEVAQRVAVVRQVINGNQSTVTGDDYRLSHQAPEPEGNNNMANVDDVLPDVYDRPEFYTIYQRDASTIRYDSSMSADEIAEDQQLQRRLCIEERQVVQMLRQARGNPNMMVTVYRAVPTTVTQINSGDWVSPSQAYAQQHAISNMSYEDMHILAAQVPAGELHNEGCLLEWGWNSAQ